MFARVLSLLCLLPSLVLAAPSYKVDGDTDVIKLDVDWLEDTSGRLTIDTIRNDVRPDQWQPIPSVEANFGYVASDFWFHFSVTNTTTSDLRRILELGYTQLDQVEFFDFRDDQLHKRILTGDRHPFNSREIEHPRFLFIVELAPGETAQIYIRSQSNGTMQMPLRLWAEMPFFIRMTTEDQMHFLYYGILSIIIVFNLFIFFMLRERTYLYYALSMVGYLAIFATIRGYGFQYLWPGSPTMQNQMMLTSIPFAALFSVLFAHSFLKLAERSRGFDKLLRVFAVICAIFVALSFVLPYNLSVRLSVLFAIPVCLVLLFIGPIEWMRGSRPAKYFTIAWGCLTAGNVIAAANKAGWLANNFLTEYGMQIGSAMEATLLTIALAERLYQEREQKLQAQDASLREHKERRVAELRLMKHALHHPVTGLPNRACFEMLINDYLRRQPDQTLAVCLIQLTRFGELNKTLGHNNADELLQAVAQKMNRILARVPGIIEVERDEQDAYYITSFDGASFGALLDTSIAGESQTPIYDILEDLNQPVDHQGLRMELAPVVGVALFPDNGVDASTLVRHAHVALEAAENRDGRLAYYKPELDRYNARRLTLMSELKQAFQGDILQLYYQPKMAFDGHRIVGVEALLRWRHHRFGFVPPDEFVPLAEQTGIIRPLTKWVAQKALSDLKVFDEKGYQLHLSINISAKNLQEADFSNDLEAILREQEIDPARLTLELTETSMMENPDQCLRALNVLRNVGIQLSIDDFGTGYSSLSYIKQLPANEIKIDKSLVMEIDTQPDDRIIVETTVEMCHNLGYQVVAEGVESAAIMEIIRKSGADLCQGFHLTKPLPLAELIDWLEIQNYKIA